MPWKKSKTIPGLITHYGRWTKQETSDFYNSVSFEDWRGSSGLVPCDLSIHTKELQNLRTSKKTLSKKKGEIACLYQKKTR